MKRRGRAVEKEKDHFEGMSDTLSVDDGVLCNYTCIRGERVSMAGVWEDMV